MGHDVRTVFGQSLTGRPDREIWSHCQLEDRLLITQDLDFSDSRKFQPGSHAGIVLVRFQNPGRLALISLMCSVRFFEVRISKRGKGALSSFRKQKFELDAPEEALKR